MKFTKDNAAQYGARGGRKTQSSGACTTRITSERASSLGRAGGTRTHEKHGSEHMARIGSRGFHTTVQRHYGGDSQAFMDLLHERGQLAICDQEFVRMIELYRQYRPDLLEV